MTDLLLDWQTTGADLKLADGDLATDETLVTAVMVSLFTDGRAELDDLPPGESSRRGWWGDTADDRIGSLLWLDRREKQIPEVAAKVARHCRGSLEWLVDAGIVERVEVDAEFTAPGLLAVTIELVRGSATAWAQAWEAAEGAEIEDQGVKVNLVLS